MPEEQNEARQALGYYDREYVQYSTFTPDHEGLPTVHFAYVPLTANRRTKMLEEMERASQSRTGRLSVKLLSEQVRTWDLRRPDGSTADPRDAREIGNHVDYNLVEGIVSLILDSRADDEARHALADFD